jgi:hypothetical protein
VTLANAGPHERWRPARYDLVNPASCLTPTQLLEADSVVPDLRHVTDPFAPAPAELVEPLLGLGASQEPWQIGGARDPR